MPIKISLGRGEQESICVDTEVYMMLFNDSVVWSLAPYQNSLANERISFNDFTSLARKAEIPYALFFAPKPFVAAQLKRKNDIILAGSTKDTFSINSRGIVEIRDIELIIKDLLRKQMILKRLPSPVDNELVGFLKFSRKTLPQQGAAIREAIGLDLSVVSKLNKPKTFEYLVDLLGSNGVYVCQSSRSYMPQTIQNHVKFSGVCIRDKNYPFIFLNNRDEEASYEPEGRKVLTLALLLVCITKAKFAPITYSQQSKNLIRDEEYKLAEEVLMPEPNVRAHSYTDLQEIEEVSNTFSVTPSALLMRLRRLGIIQQQQLNDYITELQTAFAARKPSTPRNPSPTTGIRKYNGVPFSQAVFDLIDSGKMTRSEARKILFLNKYKESFLDDFRGKL